MWILLGVVNIFLADLNQDEGWYLYAASDVAGGRMPYRDFVFTQGPVMPAVYALFRPLVSAHGILAGRWCTFFLGGLALGLTGLLAGRLVPAGRRGTAALVAVMLAGINVYQSQFTSIVKTYSLCSLLLVSGLLLLCLATRRHRPVVGVLAGVLLALAAATRLSAGIALPVVCLYLLFRPPERSARAWLYAGLGGVLGLAMAFGPFLLTATEGLFFGLFEYHAGRSAGSLTTALVYKAGFLSRMVQAYFVAAVLVVFLVVWRCCASTTSPPAAGEIAPGSGLQPMLWLAALGITAVHISAPFPYDDYQVIVYPILCAALGGGVVTLLPSARIGIVVPVLCTALLLAAFSSPVNQEWVLQERDRIWWRLKEQTPLRTLQEAGEWVRDRSGEGDELLTQDVYLAVESNRRVPPGFEMGPFCYFPEMSTERAERLHLFNRDLLEEALRESTAPVAAFSGYGLAIRSPGVEEMPAEERRRFMDLVEQGYVRKETIPHFGQASTELGLWERKAGRVEGLENGESSP